MPLKEVFLPHKGLTVKFGRRKPVARHPHLKLNNYIKKSLPTPPSSGTGYGQKAQRSLTDIYLNDQLGDCVIAGFYHVLGVTTANATGTPFIATSDQILSDYSAIGGFDPKHPDTTDQGCDEPTALNWWMEHGAANGDKLGGYVGVDPSNPEELQTALWLFENLYFGEGLPEAYVKGMSTIANGFTWDVAGDPVPEDGHCFVSYDWNPAGVEIDTWALLGTQTWAAVAKYAANANGGAVYTLIMPDMIDKATNKAPSGFAWSQLVADFDAIGGNL